MEKAYSFRFYPTPEQESLLRRTLGCVRLVYNKALHVRTQAWYERQERVGYTETSSMLTDWKKQEELDFLNEVSCVPLQQGLRHLQTAFTNFFAGRTKYPNFKKKHQGGSAEFTKSAFKFKDKQIYLAKCTEPLPIRLFGLCYAMEGGYKGWNPYIERHLAIFVNCFLSRAN